MAELTAAEPTDTRTGASGCCAPAAQATCCEPSEKTARCDSAAASGTCGCAAGQTVDADARRETVRERYAAAAAQVAAGDHASDCCGPDTAVISDAQGEQFGAALYARRAARHRAVVHTTSSSGVVLPWLVYNSPLPP